MVVGRVRDYEQDWGDTKTFKTREEVCIHEVMACFDGPDQRADRRDLTVLEKKEINRPSFQV